MLQTQLIYCGDNLQKLRELPDGSVDLIYIDPPFNSNRNYEVFWGDTKEIRSFEDRFGAVEHYIHWMRPRVMELYRVLRKGGSFYYHCDTHANAYVRVMLDQVFGMGQFLNEIAWKRSDAHNDGKQGGKQYGRIHDTIFFYVKGADWTWNPIYSDLPESTKANWYNKIEEGTGRRYNNADLTAAKPGGDTSYEWKGVKPPPGRYWAYSKAKMEEMDAQGLIVYSKSGKPYMKRYLDESKGVSLQDMWTDISMLRGITKGERLGYPTQKPLELMTRIITASSNKGDIVLDAFCGCGTTLEAAQHLQRRWIGIDISPTSCRVMAQRMEDKCFLVEGKDFWVRDLPKTAEELRRYPPFEFENWAVTALNTVIAGGHAIANRAQVGDMGIDGKVYPVNVGLEKKTGQDLFGEADRWLPVQVKQKDKASRPDIDSFETAMQRQGRNKGFFISFDFTSDALKEMKRAFREADLEIIPVTVQEILDEEVRYRV